MPGKEGVVSKLPRGRWQGVFAISGQDQGRIRRTGKGGGAFGGLRAEGLDTEEEYPHRARTAHAPRAHRARTASGI